jgi:hypothetical protein
MFIEKESVDASNMHHGHTAVGTTRVKLTDLAFSTTKGVLFRCPGSTDPVPNTAPIWIGGPAVTADSSQTGGIPILPGDSAFMPLERLDSLYVVSSVANQDIAWMGI